MRILCDIDSVLDNLQQCVLNQYNQEHGTAYTYDDITDYNLYVSLPAHVAEEMMKLYSKPSVIKAMEPLEGAMKYLHQINDEHELYIVTSTYHNAYDNKIDWLLYHYPFLKEQQVICAHTKGMVNGDVMIDDCLAQLRSHMYAKRICFNYPWNQQSELQDEVYGIIRVSNWREAYDAIEDIKNGRI